MASRISIDTSSVKQLRICGSSPAARSAGPLAALGRVLHALEAEIGTTVPSSESLNQGGISFGRDGTKRPQSQYQPASYRIAAVRPARRWPAELSEHDRRTQDGVGVVEE
jgi:hypothetical protein